MQRHRTATLVCAALLAISACADQPRDPMPPTSPSASSDLRDLLAGRTFLSTDVDGHTLVEGTQIALSFERTSINANAGCNGLGGTLSFEGDVAVVSDMLQTLMGCEAPLQEQDQWLTGLLASRPTLSLDGDVLTMTGSDVTLTLLDREVAEPDLALVGTTWTLDTTIVGETASSVPANSAASITITDGTAAVHTGCNRGNAGTEISDGVITFGPMATTKMACEQALMDLESFVTRVLSGQVSYAIEADRLTFTQSGEGETLGLVFVAQ